MATLSELPILCFAKVLRELEPHDQGSFRLVNQDIRRSTNAALDSVAIGQLFSAGCGGKGHWQLLESLRSLRSLSLHTEPPIQYWRYAELQADAVHFRSTLASLTALTSLTVSLRLAKHLGSLKWAHDEAQQVTDSASSVAPLAPVEAPGSIKPGPFHIIAWVPDWFAASKSVRRLVIHNPSSSKSRSKSSTNCSSAAAEHQLASNSSAAQASSSSSTSSSSIDFNSGSKVCYIDRRPIFLWLPGTCWSSQLACLELQGIALPENIGTAISSLAHLQQLCIVGCSSMQQDACCNQLTRLVMSHCDMVQLPPHGWGAACRLRELDISHNRLITLPPSLSCLHPLTALHCHHNQLQGLPLGLTQLLDMRCFDAGHNWLQGGGDVLQHLTAAWRQLEVLVLQNVSDKRGALVLPSNLAACSRLREVLLGDNFDFAWDSLLPVVSGCKALHVLQLSKMSSRPPPAVKAMLLNQPHLHISL